ncbi:hypothetical protein PoB_000254100 [Plakobranchus ocellatus]|uniref:Uncharacterized protein n=1 Tax=Plakobranchus ocellatus TaxID=259542 RepID=A0AAV3XYX5_9GAST|nr:hypothetical protein PoB_000254100 [Plakobranchus ocellatus]
MVIATVVMIEVILMVAVYSCGWVGGGGDKVHNSDSNGSVAGGVDGCGSGDSGGGNNNNRNGNGDVNYNGSGLVWWVGGWMDDGGDSGNGSVMSVCAESQPHVGPGFGGTARSNLLQYLCSARGSSLASYLFNTPDCGHDDRVQVNLHAALTSCYEVFTHDMSNNCSHVETLRQCLVNSAPETACHNQMVTFIEEVWSHATGKRYERLGCPTQ